MKLISKTRLAVLCLATLSLSVAGQAQTPKSLLERIGGIHKLAQAASTCVDWESSDETMMADEHIASVFKAAPKPFLSFALTEYLASLADPSRPKPVHDIAATDPTHFASAAARARAWEVRRKALMSAGIGEAEVNELVSLYVARFNAAKPMKPKMEVFKETKSLYARLGGIVPISLVVNDFIDLLGQDPVQLGNPHVVKALTDGHISIPGLKVLVTEQLAMATGGPYKYTGRTMQASHKGLMVSDKQWESAVGLLVQVLDKYKVPAKEQSEVLAAVSTMKADIVGG